MHACMYKSVHIERKNMETPLPTLDNNQSNQNPPVAPAPVADTPAPAASDRTREQFDKLRDSNSTLNSQVTNLQKQLEAARAPAPASKAPVVPDQIDLNSFVEVDPKTNERFINETKLNTAINNLQSQTTKAESTIQNYIKTNEDRRIEQQKEDAFTSHPELRPESDKFDKKFYKTVRAVLYDSMMNADEYGKTLSLKEAADYVRQEVINTSPQAAMPEAEKAAKPGVSDAKANAGTMVPSVPQNAPQPTYSEDLKILRLATRQGSTDALAQRILATDHVIQRT